MDDGTDGTGGPDDAQILQLILQAGRDTLMERMGIELAVVTRDRLEATMPVEGNRQPYGLLHGGASCVLAESLASLGAGLNAWPDRVALGVEINATHHRAVKEGGVRGVATPLHRGRTVSSWAVEIGDDSGRRVCTARVTCLLREA
ncbi:MAG TPA: hotdog fold thioesterase [Mycobacteriales bacterium]|nr:hotdog fold thioesterase [Mycobacteriales bacterium]